VEAMFNLGWFYHDGLGVAQDYQKSQQWYEEAAAAGHAAALSPTVLNPASRPDIFQTLKKHEATLPARVQRLPNSTSTITAWRAWVVERHGPEWRLRSIGYSIFWEPKIQQEAKCTRWGGHMAPDWDCQCCFWGFKSVEEMRHVLLMHDYHDVGVLGTVSLWGKVIETEHGFRAQYAYPKELWVDEGMLELGWTYNIPIRAATEVMNRQQSAFFADLASSTNVSVRRSGRTGRTNRRFVLGVRCPVCLAAIGKLCRDRNGKTRSFHIERLLAI